MPNPSVFYFGCVERAGHFLWDTSLQTLHDSHPSLRAYGFPLRQNVLDGGLMPYSSEYHPDGKVFVSHVNGWTILMFNDSSVDSRPGSHSAFIIRGVRSYTNALAIAKREFPTIFARFKFELKLGVEVTSVKIERPQ